jgi:hypothetical protein
MTPARGELRALWPSFVGAALLQLPGRQFSIFRHADRCDAWPHLGTSVEYAIIYVVAVALLAVGWQRAMRLRASARRLLGWGVAVHLVALLTPPFLSLDIFNYVATARAAAHRFGDAFLPIDRVLPAGDPLLGLMAAQCRGLGTGYLHGFVAVAWLVGKVAGAHIGLALELFRLLALAAIAAAAWLTGLAAAGRDGSDSDARAAAVATVIFCPAAIIEGTVSGHNDAWLMPAIAGFALALVRRRERDAFFALAAGLLVKATALLPLGFFVATKFLARFARALGQRRFFVVAALVTVAGIAGVYFARHQPLVERMLWELVGSPDAALPRCTRSPECVPRAILQFALGMPTTAWFVGLAFRVASALWMLWVAYRAAQSGDLLRWMAVGLFFFLLLFQSRFQAWYVLLLVPLVPFCGARLRHALAVYCVSAILYYAVRLPLNCDTRPIVVAAKELGELLVVMVPPLVALFSAAPSARASRA